MFPGLLREMHTLKSQGMQGRATEVQKSETKLLGIRLFNAHTCALPACVQTLKQKHTNISSLFMAYPNNLKIFRYHSDELSI